jgi:hypothetical protein
MKIKRRDRPRTRHPLAALLKDVGLDHGRGQIVVSEELLNGADVGAALEQVGGEGMAKGMCAEWSSGAGRVPVGLDRGVLAVDFLSNQAYKTPIMILRDY